MAKSAKKRAYHRQDMETVNRTALLIGGSVAAVVLVAMVISLL